MQTPHPWHARIAKAAVGSTKFIIKPESDFYRSFSAAIPAVSGLTQGILFPGIGLSQWIGSEEASYFLYARQESNNLLH
ncbi:MAG: hypothetical protein ABIO19_12525 [Burkholderiaceae bacterium]